MKAANMRCEHAVGLACVLATAACATKHGRDPILAARAVAADAARALERRDLVALDARIAKGTTPKDLPRRVVLENEERALAEVRAQLRAAATGRATVSARVRARGPLGIGIELEHEDGAWRVDPDTLGATLATPVAAVEHLILALERMENDPALVLLTGTLRDTIVRASRERIAGLRDVLPWVGRQRDARLSLHVSYGEGLFVDLRVESGGWRVEDFN